jgi:hypothetical protein
VPYLPSVVSGHIDFERPRFVVIGQEHTGLGGGGPLVEFV